MSREEKDQDSPVAPPVTDYPAGIEASPEDPNREVYMTHEGIEGTATVHLAAYQEVWQAKGWVLTDVPPTPEQPKE